MYLKSISVTDYSTGSQYVYGDHSGSWQSIKSVGGKVNGNIGAAPKSVASAPPVTATPDTSAPLPWSGTHRETSSFVTPSIYPWIPKPTESDTTAPTTYPGLPSGWTVTGSGRVVPPSAASVSEHTLGPRNPLLDLLLTSSAAANVPGYLVLVCFFVGLVFPFWHHH